MKIFDMWLDQDSDLCNVMPRYECSFLMSNT